LLVGKLLFTRNVQFRFIWPSGKPRENFDLEVLFPNGIAVCGETKNKVETKTFSEQSFRDALDRGREQLPKESPGVIFIKVPQHWHQIPDLMSKIDVVCRKFFRTARKIVAVEVFSAFAELRGTALHDWVDGTEFRNEKNRFGPHENWTLFTVSPDATKPTTQWWRLVDFCELG
jgi:hypothetical protein